MFCHMFLLQIPILCPLIDFLTTTVVFRNLGAESPTHLEQHIKLLRYTLNHIYKVLTFVKAQLSVHFSSVLNVFLLCIAAWCVNIL